MNAADLKAWRISRGWTVDQAARYVGAAVPTYTNWERGTRGAPDMLDRVLSILATVECLAPELHATMLPGPPVERKRPGRKPRES